MSSSISDKTSTTDSRPSRGFRDKISSLFRSPASAKYNKVLAEAYQKDSKGGDPKVEANMTDEEKAKAMVDKRDAASPSGAFILGTYKPLSVSQWYGDYYIAKGATGK